MTTARYVCACVVDFLTVKESNERIKTTKKKHKILSGSVNGHLGFNIPIREFFNLN